MLMLKQDKKEKKKKKRRVHDFEDVIYKHVLQSASLFVFPSFYFSLIYLTAI